MHTPSMSEHQLGSAEVEWSHSLNHLKKWIKFGVNSGVNTDLKT